MDSRGEGMKAWLGRGWVCFRSPICQFGPRNHAISPPSRRGSLSTKMMLVCLMAPSGFTRAHHLTRARYPTVRTCRFFSLAAHASDERSLESLSVSLRPELLAGARRLGYTGLTDIQARALPSALAGRDVVGKAKTGSGKTVVFGLALLQRLDLDRPSRGRPQALVLSPTRELAQQLVGAVRSLAVHLNGTRVVAVTGGAVSRDQRAAIMAGVHVVVGTPGRVLAMLDAGYIDPSQLRTLVLDEADSLLDMGFEDEVNRVLEHLPCKEQRQTLLFSATWPAKVEQLSARVQSAPERVSDGEIGETGGAAQVDRKVLRQRAVLFSPDVERNTVLCSVLTSSAEASALGRESVDADLGDPACADLRDPGLAVVFCETKQQCREVSSHLQALLARSLSLTLLMLAPVCANAPVSKYACELMRLCANAPVS